MAASPQFKELSSLFEITCLGIPASSRASLVRRLETLFLPIVSPETSSPAFSFPEDLVSRVLTDVFRIVLSQDDIAAMVEDFARPLAESGRPVYLLGESMGGMLALFGAGALSFGPGTSQQRPDGSDSVPSPRC